MKIKTLSRSLDNHAPARLGDPAPVSRNLDPNLHPFDKPREYTRALNAAKLDRLFAKPFVASLDGHIDGVYSLAMDLQRLNFAASGSGDGGEFSMQFSSWEDVALHSWSRSSRCGMENLNHLIWKSVVASMQLDRHASLEENPLNPQKIRLWDLSQQSLIHRYPRAHEGIIQSLCVSPLSFSNSQDGGSRRLLSCSTDRTIKLWDADPFPSRSGWAGEAESEDDEEMNVDMDATSGGKTRRGGLLSNRDALVNKSEPITLWNSKTAFNSLSHHSKKPIFASSSSSIQVWDLARGAISSGASSENASLQSMTWGPESINVVKFNPSETEVLASAGSDRGVVLYDLRSGKPITKMVMKMRANDLAWNPIEPTTFALASEDHNMYTFDMRNLTSATQIYKDHVAAVMSVNYSPTGQELVTGSYDRTLRLWTVGSGAHSRDVYHTKRMQRLFCVSHSYDSRFVISGSDDGNVRIWKSKASEALGIRSGKDRQHREYSEALRNKWRSSGEISRIERQRHVPKAIKGAQKLKRTMLEAERVKEDRRRKHTKKGEVKPTAARKDAILTHKE